MNNFKKVIISVALVATMGSTFAPAAFAQDATAIPSTKPSPAGENKCEQIHTEIEKKVDHFQDAKDKHVAALDKITDHIQKVITLLKQHGKDTSLVEADYATLKTKVSTLKSAVDAFMGKLGEIKGLSCPADVGTIKTKIGEARQLLQTVQSDKKDVVDYLKNTLIPALKSLRGQAN